MLFQEKFWKSQIKSYERLIEEERNEFEHRLKSLKEDIVDQIQSKLNKEERKKKKRKKRKVSKLFQSFKQK